MSFEEVLQKVIDLVGEMEQLKTRLEKLEEKSAAKKPAGDK